tara:strand:+ start:168 stop:719 length:552 start_codon:yes stop_codon:yes gene_type:complete
MVSRKKMKQLHDSTATLPQTLNAPAQPEQQERKIDRRVLKPFARLRLRKRIRKEEKELLIKAVYETMHNRIHDSTKSSEKPRIKLECQGPCLGLKCDTRITKRAQLEMAHVGSSLGATVKELWKKDIGFVDLLNAVAKKHDEGMYYIWACHECNKKLESNEFKELVAEKEVHDRKGKITAYMK